MAGDARPGADITSTFDPKVVGVVGAAPLAPVTPVRLGDFQ